MNTAAFKRRLLARGARFVEGGKHTKVYYRGRQSTVPRHREIPDVLATLIERQLGMR